MKAMEEHEVGICPVCGSCMLTNGKGVYIGEGYVELEVKCEECGFHGAEEYGFLNYRRKDDAMLWIEKMPIFEAQPPYREVAS